MKKGEARIAIFYLYEYILEKLKLSHFYCETRNIFYNAMDDNMKNKKVMSHKHTSGLLCSLFEYLLLNNVIELPVSGYYILISVYTYMENVDNFSFECLLVFDT